MWLDKKAKMMHERAEALEENLERSRAADAVLEKSLCYKLTIIARDTLGSPDLVSSLSDLADKLTNSPRKK